jgi:tRNA(fMet)-specific endonuclease VapC
MSRETDWLVDTNLLIHVLRASALGKHVVGALQFRTRARDPLLSAVSQGELFSIARHNNWGEQRLGRLEELLNEVLIIDISATARALHEKYAEIDTFSRSLGRQMGKNDLWIAATAAISGALLLTTDADFDHLSQNHLRVWHFDQTAANWPSVPP